MKHNTFGIIGTLLLLSSLGAAEIVVDFHHGRDARDGGDGSLAAPFRNFREAVGRAQPGDTVRLVRADEPVHATLSIHNISGTGAAPITIDGGFNTLTGALRLRAQDVEEVAPGLYKFTRDNVDEPFIWRFFMVFDDTIERMDQHSKRPCGPLKKPEELAPLEWTILDRREFYFRLPEGASLDSVKVEVPVILNGVGVANASQHVVIKNVIVKHFWNDGFNIHHASKGIVFDTVAALECGDDGVSAHTDCEITVKNMLSLGNGIGVCHGATAVGDHENLYIEGSDSRDIFMLNARNRFRNLVVVANAPVVSDFADKGDNTVGDAWFYSPVPGARFRVEFAGKVEVENMFFANYTILGNLPGATPNADPAELQRIAAAKKAELIALFHGQL